MPKLRPGPGGVRDDSDVLDEDVEGALDLVGVVHHAGSAILEHERGGGTAAQDLTCGHGVQVHGFGEGEGEGGDRHHHDRCTGSQPRGRGAVAEEDAVDLVASSLRWSGRHSDVHDHQVRPVLADQRQQLGRVAGCRRGLPNPGRCGPVTRWSGR